MTNKEMVIEILKKYPCSTGFQIKGFAHRLYNTDITPQSASGLLRSYISQGIVGKSVDPNSGKMAYWLTDYGREWAVKQNVKV